MMEVPRFKPDEHACIVGNASRHGFNMCEEVCIISVHEDGSVGTYKRKSRFFYKVGGCIIDRMITWHDTTWWVDEDDLEKV